MTNRPIDQGLEIKSGQATSLGDRLGAALEAVVIADRWASHRRDQPQRTWQSGLLRAAQACAGGDSLQPQGWQGHFQGLHSPAAALINALPYLWIKADAHGHHRAAVGRWVAELGLGAEVARACDQLFLALCLEMRAVGHNSSSSHLNRIFLEGLAGVPPSALGQAVDLATQSQGQMALALALGHQRGWDTAEIGLTALLLGLAQGRACLGARLRQRWLLACCAPEFGGWSRAGSGPDPWPTLPADALETIATALHQRWLGRRGSATLDQPAFPLGIRV